MDKGTFAIILSAVAILFGIVAIITTRPYCWELDHVGVIITTLSLLVTLLIGWNIWSVLDIKKELDVKIEKCHEDSQRDLSLHSEFNDKEFNNIIKALQRAELYTKKIDDVLFEHLSQHNKNIKKRERKKK